MHLTDCLINEYRDAEFAYATTISIAERTFDVDVFSIIEFVDYDYSSESINEAKYTDTISKSLRAVFKIPVETSNQCVFQYILNAMQKNDSFVLNDDENFDWFIAQIHQFNDHVSLIMNVNMLWNIKQNEQFIYLGALGVRKWKIIGYHFLKILSIA